MKKLYLSYLILLLATAASAQVINNGAVIQIESNGIFFIDNDFVNKEGSVMNNGEIVLTGNWSNDFLSNKVFDPSSTGTVKFIGGLQKVGGVATTRFPNLTLLNNGEFRLEKDIEVSLSLNLGVKEVFTQSHQLSLLNSDPSRLTFTTGLINTNGGGTFARATNSNQQYWYPMGSNALGAFYPVAVTPQNSSENTYAMSMINKDANLDGFTRLSKRADVESINDKYYYQLAQLNGSSPADITFLAKQDDRPFNWVVSWEGNRIWEKTPRVVTAEGFAMYNGFEKSLTATISNLNINLKQFALVKVADISDPLEMFNAFSPDGDNKNDTWEIKNIEAYPDNDVKIYDRSGNLVFRAETYNKAKAWDGQNAAPGTYFYIVRAKIGGQDKYYKGSITLVKK